MTIVRVAGLELDLPAGWREHPNPGGPSELRATADGAGGILQVSRFPDAQRAFIASQADLGACAAEVGVRLGNWGRPTGTKNSTCAVGRLGLAVFQGGPFPAMILWVTVSDRAAFMWTWLGPDLGSAELRSAVEIVVGAHFGANDEARGPS